MNRTRIGTRDWRFAALGAAVALALTLVCSFSRLYDGLANWSYDFTFLFKPSTSPDDVLLIYMDERSSLELQQQSVTWDRGLHARLLDRLREGGARLVVFDVWFGDEGSEATNRVLAAAMQAHGAVVLAAVDESEAGLGVTAHPVRPPLPMFQEAAAAWGIAGVVGQKHEIIRQYHPGTEREPSMPWAAARRAQGDPTPSPRPDLSGHWLNYYGPPGTFRSLSYSAALTGPTTPFAGKFVFIGLRSNTPYPHSAPDQFRTPYSRWEPGYVPGVDLAAAAFLNLHRQEWLTRLPEATERTLLLASAGVLGFGCSLLRLRWLVAMAVLLAPALALLAVLWVVQQQVWFPWLLIAAVQAPCVLGWRIYGLLRPASASRGPQFPSPAEAATVRVLSQLEPAAAPGWAPAAGPRVPAPAAGVVRPRAPTISDHELIRCVGRGGYGEVWLARDVIGSFHAVKLVYRSSFSSQTPFEREFRGMQRFTPLSRNHPGWIHVLHVGKNDPEGFFFYVMEAADDEVTGQEIHPDTYQPKTLARELEKRRRLPLEECLEVGSALADALDYLHGQLLVHRDIKPSNVIFVHGAPKFTDVGLVTEARNRDHSVSALGTDGYIAPEGPGAAAADIYSLGKLLYETSTGRDRFAFPATPDSLVEGAHPEAQRRLERIIAKACAQAPAERHSSAAELRDELRALRETLG